MEDNPTCQACRALLPVGARFCPGCGLGVATHVEPRHKVPEAASERPLPPMRLLPGTVLSSVYTIESVLGEGGMGVVYRAHDRARDRVVALKCLHANLSGDVEIRRRFAREAKVLRSWSHHNVVTVYDFLSHDYLLAIVMEFIDGPTLTQHLGKWRGKIPFDEIAGFLADILDAMQEGHRLGIVHRDLKPDNILLKTGPSGLQPKIVDFGIAKLLECTTYTVSGAFLGTCRYMSPEQVKNPQAADHRSDIYSLGVTLYQLCTGFTPFQSDNHFALMMAHVTEAPKPPSVHRPDIPASLERLILDALAKDPAARPSSCAEFRERLDVALGKETPRVAPASGPEPQLDPVIRESDGTEAVLIPAGPFAMGPKRRVVHLDAFYLDRMPVTNAQFHKFVSVTGYRPTDPNAHRFLAHWQGGQVPSGLENHPVANVSRWDAAAYSAWAGKRLPTEAEWEKAARGTDGRRFPWGRAEPGLSNANFGKKYGGTTPVGQFQDGASPYGILDLAGNTWEWCEDADDPEFYADGPSRNPRNTRWADRPVFVMRGGSWMDGVRALRTYARTGFEPHFRMAWGGFRCARGAF